MIDAATEMVDTTIGDKVLIEGVLMSGRKSFQNTEGQSVEVVLVRIEGRKNPIAVPVELVHRPGGDRYIWTKTDFDLSLPRLSRNVRRLRQDRNMTQFDFARAVGVSQQAVGHWERGLNSISYRYADQVSKALGISVSELFGEVA